MRDWLLPPVMSDPLEAVERRFVDLMTGTDAALDGDRLWRQTPDMWSAQRVAEGFATNDDPAEFFRYAKARDRIDHQLALAEWGLFCPVPGVRATARSNITAALALIDSGRSFDYGLGVAPASGQTASHGVKLEMRNNLLLRLYHDNPAWSEMPPRKAARDIIPEFKRYLSGRWRSDKKADVPPAEDEPIPTFFQIAKLALDDEVKPPKPGLKIVMPEIDMLEIILKGG